MDESPFSEVRVTHHGYGSMGTRGLSEPEGWKSAVHALSPSLSRHR